MHIYRKILLTFLLCLTIQTACDNNKNIDSSVMIQWEFNIYTGLSWINNEIFNCLQDIPDVQAVYTNQIQNATGSEPDFFITYNDSDLRYDHSYLLGYDQIVFIVNPENPINTILKDDILDIYYGEITSWSTLIPDSDLTDNKINVFLLPKNNPEYKLLEGFFNINKTYNNNFSTIPNFVEMKNTISNVENSIGFIMAKYLDTSVKSISIDKNIILDYPIIISTKVEPTGKEMDLIKCLNNNLNN